MKRLIRIMSTVLAIMLLLSLMPTSLMTATAAGYEYAYFPGNVLKVTQGAYGEYNSYSHNGQGGYVQNAFDLSGNSNYCAPFSGTITSIKTSYNAVVLQSDDKVYWADGTCDYMSVTFVHDNDISDLYVGKHVVQGEVFYQPGVKDPGGYTTGTHLHICVNRGKTNDGIRYFSGDVRPNAAFFLKDSVTIQQTGNYEWKKTTTHTYDEVTPGNYYIKHKATGNYLDLYEAVNANAQNIWIYPANYSYAQYFAIEPSTTTVGYAIRPEFCSRMLNVYADTVVSGKNVCIYDNTGDGSQRWFFEKKNDGYVIRNVQNPNCVLDVENGSSNVYVNTYNGSDSQIWILETNCSHTYTNACDTTCNKCGKTRTVSGHSYHAATCTKAKTCSICGAASGSALGHTYTNNCDESCNRCGATRTAPHTCAKLSITTQPKTAYAKKGAYVTTTVKATGEGLTYQWYVRDVGDTKWYVSSQKTNTYKVKVSASNHNRKAYCVVKDKHGKTVTTNTVYLRMSATITTQPKTAYAKKGAHVTTTVKATGEGLTYTWYVRDVGDTKWYVSSQKTNTYKVKVSASNHNRKAYCVVKDKYGKTVTTNTVYLRMKATITTQPKSVTVRKNNYASTTVKASGVGLRYVWYVKSAGDAKYYKSSVTASTYKVKMTSKVNGRKLICYVYDAYGNKVQSKTVVLKMK